MANSGKMLPMNLKRLWRTQKYFIVLVVFCVTVLFMTYRRDYTHRLMTGKVDLSYEYLRKKWYDELALGIHEGKDEGCDVPKLDPFASEIMGFKQNIPEIVCKGKDWVNCYHDECRVIPEILATKQNVCCIYKDLLYKNDKIIVIGSGTKVCGAGKYYLVNSDHVKVTCVSYDGLVPSRWFGYKVGLRHVLKIDKGDGINVLIIAFDSTSHNGFQRRMPSSLKMLTEELDAVVLNKIINKFFRVVGIPAALPYPTLGMKAYNVIGEGTVAALFPLFTGKSELEHPDCRKLFSTEHVDEKSLIFDAATKLGYRTVYYEDMPSIGTFQHHFNGFKEQPADHYLRSHLMMEPSKERWDGNYGRYCVGDTPQHILMFNLTEQFFHLNGRLFAFTFVTESSHDSFNISPADVELVALLRKLKAEGKLEDTVLIVMGDHGNRYKTTRASFQGKFEELLPLMAIHLPPKLKHTKPNALKSLRGNAEVLTTAFDVHTTLLEILELDLMKNQYRVHGSDIPRGMSLLEPIPVSRICAEAGVVPYWCACATWRPLPPYEAMYPRVAYALLEFINNITTVERSKCHELQMKGIEWVVMLEHEKGLATPKLTDRMNTPGDKEEVYYVSAITPLNEMESQSGFYYQAKIVTTPGNGVFEGGIRYLKNVNKIAISPTDISRTTETGHAADCISYDKPYLEKYCTCK